MRRIENFFIHAHVHRSLDNTDTTSVNHRWENRPLEDAWSLETLLILYVDMFHPLFKKCMHNYMSSLLSLEFIKTKKEILVQLKKSMKF